MKRKFLLSYLALLSCTYAALPMPVVDGETFDCLMKPYVVINISSAVEGVLKTVTVDRGDSVQQDQILAGLESGAEQATVARQQAQAAMEAPIKINQERLELSTRQLLRSEGLYQKSLIAADELDKTETTKRLAKLNLQEALEKQRVAELELQRAIEELTRRTIKSPITGVVVERLRNPGEFADANPILTLAQMHPLRVEVFLPVGLLGQVEVGMRAKVMPEAPVGGVYEAHVTVVDRVVDAASGMFGVRLELPNPNYRLPAGLKCQVSFPREPGHTGSTELQLDTPTQPSDEDGRSTTKTGPLS